MVKILNKYFSIIMLALTLSTVYLYKYRVSNFINNSVEHTIVISSNISEENKIKIKNKLKDLTYQDVVINEKDDCIYVKIKCPPERLSFFSKLICNKFLNNED